MTKKRTLGIIAVLALAIVGGAFAQETDEARNARLAELHNNNARYAALASRMATPAAGQAQPQAIILNIAKPLFFATSTTGAQIQWLADTNRNGRADLVGTFWGSQNSNPTALTSFGGYLYAYDGQSSILRFTDTNSDGVTDAEPTEVFAGAAYTGRMFAYDVDKLYVQDNGRARLLRYNVGVASGTTFNQNLPKLGSTYIDGTLFSPELRTVFTIDQNDSTVKVFPFNSDGSVGSQGRTVFSGQRIANIAVDGASGQLFVTQAGECVTAPQPPGAAVPDQTPTICSSGRLSMGSVNGGPRTDLAVGGWMFNVDYNSQPHSMLAFDGKVYVTVFSAPPQFNNARNQIIVTYNTAGQNLENQAGTVFADQTKLGDGFITSLTTFAGGPVTNITQPSVQ